MAPGAPGHRLRPAPTPEQRRAADPACSAWVTASAGTGKTQLLTDRVLRLLLAGTDPRQILCLTFTKAAAAEMVTRVQGDLGRFAVLPESALPAELATLLGRDANAAELACARRLFALVLDLPAGLPIMTIHGFCQSLLKRFPLEAGVVPHFEVIEQRSAADLLHEAQEEVLASPRADLQDALACLAVLLGESGIAEGLAALRDNRLRLDALLERAGGLPRVIGELERALDLPPGATVEEVLRAACADPAIDCAGLGETCRALPAGSRTETIAAWLDARPSARMSGYGDYQNVFLTKDDGQPKQWIGKLPDGRVAEALRAEQERLLRHAERLKAAAIAQRTGALLRIGAAVVAVYERRKQRQSGLDYDDLIACTLALLRQPGLVSWVNYKLDQQIDHLLIDEGQDTSPEQWAIIEALVADFFAGEGARPHQRSLFVVGDEKQSIMSVQGADLETFQHMHARFGARARAAGVAWLEVPLRRSFRSAPAVLRAVDAVFGSAAAREGVVVDDEPLRHESARKGAPGVVELWPLAEIEPAPADEAWQLPDRPEPTERAERALAEAIGIQIRNWLLDGTPLPSGERPIQAQDVMILLPRRGVLQDLLVRQLKRLRVPVAGADRLALTDEIAVMDLMALGDALLLPEDDLTLAAVLKSPLFGLDEEQLFALACERGTARLYQRLGESARDHAHFASAHERFSQLLAQADYLPPFELYGRLLSDGGALRQFVSRLGSAAIEPIEAFLAQALAYEQSHPPSLQGFLHWLRADATELIRDPDRPRDEVRVLTVHGAKGLEAPIVFLLDTTFVPDFQDRLLWHEPQGLPLWRMGSKERERVSAFAYERARTRQLQEQRRLLYVGLTRAREHLILAGCQRKNARETTWHDLVEAALPGVGAERVGMRLAAGLEGDGWRLAERTRSAPQQLGLALHAPPPAAPEPPLWLQRAAPAEARGHAPLTPSRGLADEQPAALSPLQAARAGSYRRGRLIHRLLQSLPERPPDERHAALTAYLALPSLGLDPAAQAEIAAEVEAVLALPELAALFGPHARAEVPLAGVVGDQVVFGQVDRLAVTAREVLLIDYKTNRQPPATPALVPAVYLRQMAAYCAVLQAIYPDRPVRAALLWTEGPHLMALDDATLASHWPGSGQA